MRQMPDGLRVPSGIHSNHAGMLELRRAPLQGRNKMFHLRDAREGRKDREQGEPRPSPRRINDPILYLCRPDNCVDIYGCRRVVLQMRGGYRHPSLCQDVRNPNVGAQGLLVRQLLDLPNHQF